LRAHSLHKLGAQTVLLGVYTFIAITATWIDAFNALRSVDLNVESLGAPILTSTAYYLAAVIVFPSRSVDLEHLDDYYLQHKKLVIGLLLAAELLVNFTFLPLMIQGYREGQPSFFYFYLPFHVVQKVAYAGAYLAKSKRSNIAWLALLNLLLLFNYWDNGAIPQFIDRAYGAL
jgi:hypothetical protein